MLYDGLPGISDKILLNTTISSIKQDDHGVEVTCNDGTSFTGDMLIGADGVYSAVRRLTFHEDSAKIPFLTNYNALVCASPRIPGLDLGCSAEIHSRNHTVQYFPGQDSIFFAAFSRLDRKAS